jgi:hypothetical protein
MLSYRRLAALLLVAAAGAADIATVNQAADQRRAKMG